MNTTQLECFIAVAQCLNFSKAAESINITQPAVSHQINSLEDELDTKLFIRTSKSVELTKAGIQFINDAETIIKIASSAKMKLSEHIKQEPLIFSIGCHNQFELNMLPSIINKLINEFPKLHPIIKLIPFQSMENLVEDGTLDVMYGFRKESSKKTNCIYNEIIKSPVVCICHKDNPLSKKNVLSECDLKGNMVLSEPRKGPRVIFKIQSRISLNRPSEEVFFGDSYESTITLIKSGIGFTVLPDIPYLREPDLCYIPINDLETISFGVHYKNTNNNPVLKRFLQIINEAL